jgi:hypothetical protein
MELVKLGNPKGGGVLVPVSSFFVVLKFEKTHSRESDALVAVTATLVPFPEHSNNVFWVPKTSFNFDLLFPFVVALVAFTLLTASLKSKNCILSCFVSLSAEKLLLGTVPPGLELLVRVNFWENLKQSSMVQSSLQKSPRTSKPPVDLSAKLKSHVIEFD